MKRELNVISHTHWDREWYFPFEEYRVRLVRAMDDVLDILENNPEFKYFNFDGQTVVLEDYLAVKPENGERIKKLIEAGRLLVGPWYILPDEFLVSGESLVRNYLVGDRTLNDYGKKMNVGYLPDMFGHTAQMPQILLGLGLDNAIIWRGISGEPVLKSEFNWEAPDGSKVLAVHLPDNIGYANAQFMPTDMEQALGILKTIQKDRGSVATTPYLMVMNGVDHMPPDRHMPEIIRYAKGKLDGDDIVHSNLQEYVEKVKSALPQSLQTVRGELRDVNRMPENNNINFLFYGVLSSRMDLKIRNDASQRGVEQYAEPLSVMAGFSGMAYPKEFLYLTWKYILLNQPHDNICGCSVDGVSRNMYCRFDAIEQLTRQLNHEAMRHIALQADTQSLQAFEGQCGGGIVVYNSQTFPRGGVVTAELEQPAGTYIKGIRVFDENKREIPSKIIGVTRGKVHADNYADKWPMHTSRKSDFYTVSFYADEVPAAGYRAYSFAVSHKPSRYDGGIVRGSNVLENEFLKVEFQPNGSFDLTDKETGKRYSGCNSFEDGGDNGDGYSYSYPQMDVLVTTKGGGCTLSVTRDDGVLGAISAEYDFVVPEGLNEDKTGRSAHTVKCPLKTEVSLGKHDRFVRIKTELTNNAKNHRLRALFPTELDAERFYTDSQFALVERLVSVEEPSFEAWIENAPRTVPMQNFADLSDGEKGLAVVSRGLPEIEVLPERGNAFALTLMRAFAKMGNCDALTIKLGGGPEFDAPESQCLFPFTFEYALYPHAGGVRDGGVYRAAWGVNQPVAAMQTDFHTGNLPSSDGMLKMESPDVVVTAVKEAEDGNGIIVRAYNPFNAVIKTKLTVKNGFRKVALVDLAEREGKELAASGSAVKLEFAPCKIVTVKISR